RKESAALSLGPAKPSEAKEKRRIPWSALLTKRMLAQGVCSGQCVRGGFGEQVEKYDGEDRLIFLQKVNDRAQEFASGDWFESGLEGDFAGLEDFQSADAGTGDEEA